MKLEANWSYPTAIRFGAGRIAELPDACADAGISKPLLVTDRGLADLLITARALDSLEAAGLGRALFADVDPNPNETTTATPSARAISPRFEKLLRAPFSASEAAPRAVDPSLLTSGVASVMRAYP